MSSTSKNEAVAAVATANSNFSARLFNALKETHPKNLIYSPSSVSTLMAMIKQGAQGGTADDIDTTMAFPEKNATLLKGYNQWMESYEKSSNKYVLAVANKIYGNTGFRMNGEFLATLKDNFKTEVDQLDFSQAQHSATTINNWIEKTTRGKITDLIDPGSLNALTQLVLVSAIYFKGDWSSPFEKMDTKKAPFFLNSKDEVNADMMYQRNHYPYVDLPQLNAHAVALPYTGDQLSMVIIAPKTKCGLQKLENELGSLLSRQSFLPRLNPPTGSATKKLIKLRLPKFTARSCLDLNYSLSKMGFGSMKKDFSGISANGQPLFVSEFFQEAFIEVNEKGTEAAAVTCMIACIKGRSKRKPPVAIKFDADRPFLFQIVDFRSNMVLFMGKITNPTL